MLEVVLLQRFSSIAEEVQDSTDMDVAVQLDATGLFGNLSARPRLFHVHVRMYIVIDRSSMSYDPVVNNNTLVSFSLKTGYLHEIVVSGASMHRQAQWCMITPHVKYWPCHLQLQFMQPFCR